MTSQRRDAGPALRAQSAILFIAIVLTAAAIYRPWQTLPFDIWDFREFLPLLKSAEGPWNQLVALVEYYATHGRANLLFYASFVVQWQLFGLDPSGWQWWRFGLMLLVLLLSMVFLRRLGASPWGAAAGTALLVASSPVQRGWIQLMAEPQALALLLVAGLLALDYQGAERWGRRAWLIAALVLGVFLSKEVVGVLGGFVLLLAVCRGADGTWRWPLWQRRDFLLAGLTAGVVVVVSALLFYVRGLPVAEGYGMSYGAGSLDPVRLGENFLRAMLPHHVAADIRLGFVYPSNVLFILVVVLGVHQRMDATVGKRWRTLLESAGVLLLPLAGAAIYWPWPKWDSFYGLPFFFGSVLLLAVAVTVFEAAGAVRRHLAHLATAAIVGYSALVAQRSLSISEAILRLNVELAHEMAVLGPAATVVVVGPEEESRRLPVTGIEIKEYAAAIGLADLDSLPRVFEAGCEAVPPLLAGGAGSILLVSYSYGCGRLPGATTSLQQEFAYRDWLSLGQRHGNLTMDFIAVVSGGNP